MNKVLPLAGIYKYLDLFLPFEVQPFEYIGSTFEKFFYKKITCGGLLYSFAAKFKESYFLKNLVKNPCVEHIK